MIQSISPSVIDCVKVEDKKERKPKRIYKSCTFDKDGLPIPKKSKKVKKPEYSLMIEDKAITIEFT